MLFANAVMCLILFDIGEIYDVTCLRQASCKHKSNPTVHVPYDELPVVCQVKLMKKITYSILEPDVTFCTIINYYDNIQIRFWFYIFRSTNI